MSNVLECFAVKFILSCVVLL